MTSQSRTDRAAWTGIRRALCAALLSGGAVLGLGQAASAQFAFEDDILPPRVVAWRLAERGFSGLGRPRFDGRVYVVDAVGPAGVPVRLFVDPAVGAIVGRQRLGPPEAYARLERPGPGFGWTEEDAGPRRALRPVPPEAVPAPAARPVRRPGAEAARPGASPDGVNPDGPARPGAPRRVARAAPPARQPELKPALRTAPEAPAPTLAPVETAKAAPTPEASPAAPAASVDTAAPADAAPAKPAPAKPAADGARAEAARTPGDKPPAQDWKDPPADKRPVRVIDGATVVPGTAEKDAGATQ